MKEIKRVFGKGKKNRRKGEGGSELSPLKVFYCHIPKCAGTSVSNAMRQKLCANRSSRKFSIGREASQRAGEVISKGMMDVRETILAYNLSNPRNRFGRGHVWCRPHLVDAFSPEWSFVTLLRNPVSRWISLFTYNTYKTSDWLRISQPIEEFLESSRGRAEGEVFLRYFSSMPHEHDGNIDEYVDEAMENLSRFALVGTVENLDGWRRSFHETFGKEISILRKNISPNMDAADKIRSNDALIKRIEEVCEPDLRLYRRVVEKFTS